MILKNIAWSAWALIPVAALAYHFGPGQRSYLEDRAGDLLSQARTLDTQAEAAQDSAYQAHLAALAARKSSLDLPSPESTAAAKAAADAEDTAYTSAATAWAAAADKLREAQEMLTTAGSEKAQTVRVARNRALVRAGNIAEGVGDLELMLDTLTDAGQGTTPLADQAREEVATGYYYGARLLRASGKPTSEWREVSGWSRQNFRYLAEKSGDSANPDPQSAERQKNLELVLNLEQTASEDLQAKPLPKYSPRGGADGLRDGKNPGKTKRPPRRKSDARGAGGTGEIEGGW